MRLTVDRAIKSWRTIIRPIAGVNARSRRRFRAQLVFCLEERALLSTFVANHPEPAPAVTSVHAGHHERDSGVPWTAVRNVSFPTVDGQSELLDVYTPRTPAPTGGFPVMIAIHGGGWRRLDKTGYGLRNANVFTRDGYVVVAPNYVLSAPGRTTWPENFEDVQAAVQKLWQQVTSENLKQISDFAGYKANFLKLFGFGLPGVNYEEAVDPTKV